MANVYAVKSGNWSDTTVWNTSVLPTTTDDVYSNNFSVTIDGNYQVNSIRNNSGTTTLTGGRFYMNNATTLSAFVVGGWSNTPCLTFLSAAPNFCTLVGNLCASAAVASPIAILNNDSGTFNIYGSIVDIINSATGTTNGAGITNNSTGTINISGNVTGGNTQTGSVNSIVGIRNNSTGTVNITGDVTGGIGSNSGGFGCEGIRNNGNITVIGSVIGGKVTASNQGIANNSTGTVTVYGRVVGGTTSNGIVNNSNGTVNISGGPVLSDGVGAITNAAAGTVTIVGTVSSSINAGCITNGSTGTISITGNVYGSFSAPGGKRGISVSNGNCYVYGDVYAGWGGGTTPNDGIAITLGYLYVKGNLYGTAVGGNQTAAAVLLNGGGKVDVLGSALSSIPTAGGGAAGVIFNSSTTGTFNLTGDVYGSGTSNYYGAYNSSTGIMNIYGTVYGGIAGVGAVNNSTGSLYMTKVIGNSYGLGLAGVNSVVGASNVQNGKMYVEQVEFGSRGQTPISGPVYILPSNRNTLTGYTTAVGAPVTFYNSLSVSNLLPPASSVRLGTVYNVGNSTGTMAVPSASAVQFGVAVDNTTGTAALQPQDVWGYARLSATQVNSMGDRLRNVATTQSVGQQIASFNL